MANSKYQKFTIQTINRADIKTPNITHALWIRKQRKD